MPGVDWGTEQRGLSVRRCAGAGAGSCLCPVRRHGGEAQLCIARLQPALASSSFHTEPHLYRPWPLCLHWAGGKQETLAACCLLLLGADNVFITAESHGRTTPPGHYDASHQCWPPPPLPASWLAVVTLVSKVEATAARSLIHLLQAVCRYSVHTAGSLP